MIALIIRVIGFFLVEIKVFSPSSYRFSSPLSYCDKSHDKPFADETHSPIMLLLLREATVMSMSFILAI